MVVLVLVGVETLFVFVVDVMLALLLLSCDGESCNRSATFIAESLILEPVTGKGDPVESLTGDWPQRRRTFPHDMRDCHIT